MPQFDIWPSELEHLLPQLERYQHAEILETKMDAGPPKRRPKSSPLTYFGGTVQMTGAQWTMLDHFSRTASRMIKIRVPDSLEECIVSFARDREGRQTPHCLLQTSSTAAPSKASVSIALVVSPHSAAILRGTL